MKPAYFKTRLEQNQDNPRRLDLIAMTSPEGGDWSARCIAACMTRAEAAKAERAACATALLAGLAWTS